MSYSAWLETQVSRLEEEIREHEVFDSERPASAKELEELRTKIVIHRYLKQQLQRRNPRIEVPDFDTAEFILVRQPEKPPTHPGL